MFEDSRDVVESCIDLDSENDRDLHARLNAEMHSLTVFQALANYFSEKAGASCSYRIMTQGASSKELKSLDHEMIEKALNFFKVKNPLSSPLKLQETFKESLSSSRVKSKDSTIRNSVASLESVLTSMVAKSLRSALKTGWLEGKNYRNNSFFKNDNPQERENKSLAKEICLRFFSSIKK